MERLADRVRVEPLGVAEGAEGDPDVRRQDAAEVDEQACGSVGRGHGGGFLRSGGAPLAAGQSQYACRDGRRRGDRRPGRRRDDRRPDGIAAEAVEEWFADNVDGVVLPLSFEMIAGGRSNLTYRVSDAEGWRWALRRPPLGKTLGSAHDMGREARVVGALAETPVPVPSVAGFCEDAAVNEAPFYVMDFLPGPILRDQAAAEPYSAEQRRRIGENVVDTLVAIHEVDPDQVGLGELGKKADYVARTLHRWSGQWEKSKTRELPLVTDVHDRLAAGSPSKARRRSSTATTGSTT